MGECCQTECGFDPRDARQRRTLRIVLAINAVMFLVILAAALVGRSSSLMADSLDNLGDAVTYGFSLYAVSKAASAKAKVALFKGGLILAAAIGVAVNLVYKLNQSVVPSHEIMGAFAIAGLAANSICLGLLWRHRNEDINMASVWQCSRNDITSNLSVFIAAGAVWAVGSGWPDLLIAAGLLVLLLTSAFRVNLSAYAELRTTNQTTN